MDDTLTQDRIALVARILLASLFVLAGIGKIAAPAATIDYIGSVGLPLPAIIYGGTIAVEILGGLALLIGFKTRYAGLALALFSIAAAFLFHNKLADQMQMTMFLKNLALAGGLLMVFAFGPGRLSIDKG